MSIKCLVKLSVGGILFAVWNPELWGFGWLLHLNDQASSISLLRREAMKAWVLWSHHLGLSFVPSLARWSAFSLLVMFTWPV